MEAAAKALETRVKSFARDIRDKYIDPPHTTDFGIMFLAATVSFAGAEAADRKKNRDAAVPPLRK